MFCPNCGANNAAEQSFCRSCGLKLEEIAKSLLLQIPSAESAELLKQERRLEKFGNVAWVGFEIVLLVGVIALLYSIINSLVLSGKNPLVGILLAAFVFFGTLTLIYVAFNKDLEEKKKKINLNKQKEIVETKITAKLLEETHIEPFPSVTENSTNLLFVEPKRKISGELK